jgi:3',5'-cyclic AMP phosphodiesterase CpdA
MVELSEPVFLQAVAEIKKEKPDVLLVPGDMAFNGELINHLIVKSKLQELADLGIKVLTVPGNNDINSTDAMIFTGTGATPVSNISPADFVSIYGNFGYNDALYRDIYSLSYIFQLRDDLWILGIDDCIYSPVSKRSGSINPGTMSWILEMMDKAADNGITVLAMMHHGVTEHYSGQNTVNKGDVVNDFNSVSSTLRDAGIKLIFTGHAHANDIVEISGYGNTMFDIQTGSLITPPSPYRIMTLDDNYIKIETKRITEVEYEFQENENFLSYSDSYLSEHLDLFFNYYLRNFFGVPEDFTTITLPHLRNSIMAHFAGDEKISPEEEKGLEELEVLLPDSYDFLVPIINNFWTDLPPNDNKIHIKLK